MCVCVCVCVFVCVHGHETHTQHQDIHQVINARPFEYCLSTVLHQLGVGTWKYLNSCYDSQTIVQHGGVFSAFSGTNFEEKSASDTFNCILKSLY